MDPTLPETPGQKIKRQIDAIKAQGGSDADIEAFLAQHPSVKQGPSETSELPRGASLAPLASGLTMGLSDEILGGLEGASQALHGGSFKKGYSEGKAKVSDVGERYRVEHPVASDLLEVAGSIPTVVATGGAGAAEQGLGMGARLGKAALAGMKYGAFGGAATADGGIQERAQGALSGAAKGAAFGPLIEAGGTALGGFGRALGIPQGVSKGAAALSSKVPAGRFSDFLQTVSGSTGAEGRASSEITKRLASEGRTPESVSTEVSKNTFGFPGPTARPSGSGSRPEILADYSPEVSSLTKAVTKEPGPGRASVNRALADRAKGTRGRLINDVTQGKAPSPIAPEVESMVRAREASAEKLFPKAYAAGASGVDDPAITELFQRPTMGATYKMAQKMAADDGVALPSKTVNKFPAKVQGLLDAASPADRPAMEARLLKAGAGQPVEIPIPDVRTIHYVDRALRRMIEGGYEGNAPVVDAQHAAVLQKSFGQLRDRMSVDVPEFGQALEDYSKRSGQIDAMQTGSNLFKYLGGSKTPAQAMAKGDPLALKAIRQGVDGLESAVHNMSPENRALFRQGAQAAVVKAINKVPGTVEGSTAPVLRRIFGNTPEASRWQRLLFETPEEANTFQSGLAREWNMAATKARMGGSDTAENLNERDALTPSGGILTAIAHPLQATKAAYAAGSRTARRNTYGALGEKLSASGHENLVNLLARLEAEQQLQEVGRKAAGTFRNALSATASR